MKHFGTCALFLLLVLLIGDALAAPKLLHKYAKDMLMFPSTKNSENTDLPRLTRILGAWKGLNSSALPPVLLVPGLGASVLEASLKDWTDDPCARSLFGGRPGVWRDLWLNTNAILQTARLGCLYEYLTLRWNGTRFHDHPDLIVRAKDFGGINGVSSLVSGPSGVRLYPYFRNIIRTFRAIGYEPGVDLRAAPYDWRRGYLVDLYARMRRLIEDMSKQAGGQPVWIIAHSLGGWQTNIMLSKVSDEWKEKYIAGFITLGTPWLGASSAVLAVMSPLDIDLTVGPVKVIDAQRLHGIAKNYGSLIWLMPRAVVSHTGFLVKSPSKEYTMTEYKDMLHKRGLNETSSIFEYYVKEGFMKAPFKPPNVPLYCVYGSGVNTKTALVYDEEDLSDPPEILMSTMGDGTVPMQSLKGCEQLGWGQKEPVQLLEFPGLNHNHVLLRTVVLRQLIRLVLSEVYPVSAIVGTE